MDKCLPMGCSVSCSLFEKFSTFLQWVIQFRTGLDTIDHYLDDFIFIGTDSSEDCLNLMSSFQNLCYELNIPIAEDKTVGPVTVLKF